MAGKLKPLDVERETRPGKYPDGDGLYLVVASATSKNWSYRYWKDGKQRWLGLGSVKDVSLKDARLARDAARLRVKGDRSTPGVDIVQEKRAAREEAKATEIKVTLPPSRNAPKSTFASAGRPGARSIAISGRHRLNATLIRRSENSLSRRSSPATSTNCCGPFGLRSERQLIVSADGSKRSSRRTSMLTTPIFEIPPSSPNSSAARRRRGRLTPWGALGYSHQDCR